MGKKQFCFFQTAETGNRTPDSGVKDSGANHYPGAPALLASGELSSMWLRDLAVIFAVNLSASENPLLAKVSNLNFHSPEVVSR